MPSKGQRNGQKQENSNQKRYLVIGGGGFLGRYIVEQLLDRGETRVIVFDVKQTFEDKRLEKYLLGDITKLEDVLNAFSGVTTVIHTASLPHNGKNTTLMYKVNVDGTKNVIDACIRNGVKQLIYTSSASVVFEGKDLKNADETSPYSKRAQDPYDHSKQLAEREVLAANGKDGLVTCALRPSGLFGPRDAQAWPGFIAAAKEGKSKYQIGDGSNLFDWSYVENIAYGHLLAADKLESGSAIGGQVYFLTNGEPMKFWDFANYVFTNMGYPPTKFRVPYTIVYYYSVLLVFICHLLGYLGIKMDPTFTPLRVANAGCHRFFSIEKAKRELGYKPIYSLKEGMEKTLAYFKSLQSQGKI